ncbi:hypothetical protein AB0F88_08580 [Streptosporangium sp. NPDC023963]|uniref:hypothetical protein n=1 Tax=Streptosporangium sp. NPDC023963 TaxID=3155608 RepID=UPI00341EE5E5
MADVKNDTFGDIESRLETDIPDLNGFSLARVGSWAEAGLLKRVLPEPSGRQVDVAAFNSSI